MIFTDYNISIYAVDSLPVVSRIWRQVMLLLICGGVSYSVCGQSSRQNPGHKQQRSQDIGQGQLTTSVLRLTDLRTAGKLQPAGLGTQQLRPMLSWRIEGDRKRRDIHQTAYQIQVASSMEKLLNDEPDFWDSRRLSSDRSIGVAYGGKLLQSRDQLFWRVRVWTTAGNTGWSEPARWTMGLLKQGDWQADWIGRDEPFATDRIEKFPRLSARYLRREFKVEHHKKVKRAFAYISGLGLYELHLNGQKASEAVLAPGPTDYSKTVFYNTLDVTSLLQAGQNAIGVILGNGRYFTMRQEYKPWKWHQFGMPKLCMQLEITYEDGSRQMVLSDTSWQLTAMGPIRANNEYDGETYDARMEMSGWDRPGYLSRPTSSKGTTGWQSARLVAAPKGRLQAALNENMQIVRRLTPAKLEEKKTGEVIVDMGQNMAGWLRIHLDGRGHKGDTVILRFAESLTGSGQLYTANLRDAKSTDKYIIKGEANEKWSPRFVYHGFRYVSVAHFPGKPTLADFEGQVVSDPMETAGSFTCSDTTINQVYRNAVWGILSNYKGMPVDCPQRNERQPWLGDRTTGAYGETFAFNNHLLYAKWLQDIEDAQLPMGSLPDVAPNFWFYYKDDVTWPSTYLTVAAMLYQQYGDAAAIRRHYGSMKLWIQYMHHQYVKKGIIDKDSYGDWCVPPDSLQLIHSRNPAKMTSGALLATATFYHDLQLMQGFAGLSGKIEDTAIYGPMAREMRTAFQEKFFDQDKQYYGNNSVTANLLPLAFGLVPKASEQAVFEHIADKTEKTYNGHISTGVIGTQWLLRTLSAYGRNDLALRLAGNRSYPSWGYMVANGATTIWELWNGNTANPAMNSQNHVMLLGDLLIWLYENQAGIASDKHPDGIGFGKIIMAPKINGPLKFVRATHRSAYGLISSDWEKKGTQWSWKVTIPPNASAQLKFPAGLLDIREGGSGLDVKGDAGKKLHINLGENRHLSVGSGNYIFTGILPKESQ